MENDDKHTFAYVIDVLRRICGHSSANAYCPTDQIHLAGQAVMWSGTLEVAEIKRDQIREYATDNFASQPVISPLGVPVEPRPE